jgi:2-polyprenyl-3-methyl-5-hydroxy-6-metoxy-1,4-benzoquinol methylase
MTKVARISNCLCCNNDNLEKILDLGSQPLANNYEGSYESAIRQAIFPLGINLCRVCWNAQLTHLVDRSAIFENYSYKSGTSRTLTRYFSWFASCLKRILPSNSRVLELAANDGSLIKELRKKEICCLGIDPASDLVDRAVEEGLPMLRGSWPDIATLIDSKYDCIVAMNVLAHVGSPREFLDAASKVLTDSGIIFVQPSQARIFANHEFDTIYHEHVCFFNSRSIEYLASSVGLKLIGELLVTVHGDSPIYVLAKSNTECSWPDIQKAFARHPLFFIDEDLKNFEVSSRLFHIETYQMFKLAVEKSLDKLRFQIESYRKEGFKIALVGAAAKAMTVLNSAKINVDIVIDENPLKIGKYPPLNDPPSVSPLDQKSIPDSKTIFIVGAWNFFDEITSKLARYSVATGSIACTYFDDSRRIYF